MSNFYERNRLVRPLENAKSRSELLDNRSREYLLRNAFLQIRVVRRWRGRTLQEFVSTMTSHGSGYSEQICKELGWDPDMQITPSALLPYGVATEAVHELPPELDSRYPNNVMAEPPPDDDESECAACLAHPTGVCSEHFVEAYI